MDADDLARVFEGQRARLRDVARGMLGSDADAQDVVQECWLRLRRADVSGVENLPGWLTTVASRICLDRLRARGSRREVLTDRTPEPGATSDDPAHDAVVADSVGRALAVVLDTLSPAERVALVLHDVFAIPYDEIAPVLERSGEATKKLAGRARRRVQLRGAAGADDLVVRRQVVATFLAAIRAGDMEALFSVLAPDVVRRVDPVLIPPGAPTTVRGARAVVEEARSMSAPARDARPAMIDGAPGAVVRDGTRPTLALVLTVAGGLVAAVDVVGSPDRLAALTITDDPTP